MDASEIREMAHAMSHRSREVRDSLHAEPSQLAELIYGLTVEVERLQQQRTDLEIRLAAVERRVGALEEPMP